ncbi:MAG TPA: glucokinase [Desulfonatronum sp.]|nr:glucokinase [Desulfonatronum sp.]
MPRKPVTLLAADIGGTSSRFAVFSDDAGQLRLDQSVRIPTIQAASFAELLVLLKQGPLGRLLPRCCAAALAVAGAVQGGVFAKPPNIPWEIDLRTTDLAGLPKQVTLLNDFAAQAYACGTGIAAQAVVINPSVVRGEGVVAVIGAGTGLGHGLLIRGKNSLQALPSEAGHMAFAFSGKAERDYERFLLERTGLEYIHADVVVSGRGLTLLHAYHFQEELEPARVASALTPDSPVQDWFARFYGRASRQFALAVLAMGGIFVTGGVAAKNPNLVLDPAFMAEFVNSPAYGRLLQSIPVSLNTNEDSGLWGAALSAQLSLRR